MLSSMRITPRGVNMYPYNNVNGMNWLTLNKNDQNKESGLRNAN